MSRRTVQLRKKLRQCGGRIDSIIPHTAESTGRTQITQHKYSKKPSRFFVYYDSRGLQVIHVYEVEDIKKVKGSKGERACVPISERKLGIWKANLVRPGKRS